MRRTSGSEVVCLHDAICPAQCAAADSGDDAYKLPMATIGHWNKEGTMDEEYLYWDNAAFMKMIGVAK